MEITIRRATPDDAEDIARIFDTPRALRGTLQVPYTSVEFRRRRMSEVDDTLYPLAAVVDGEVVGQLTLHGITRPRRKHAAGLGMAVRDDMQGQGVGTALMQACVDLADNWLNHPPAGAGCLRRQRAGHPPLSQIRFRHRGAAGRLRLPRRRIRRRLCDGTDSTGRAKQEAIVYPQSSQIVLGAICELCGSLP